MRRTQTARPEEENPACFAAPSFRAPHSSPPPPFPAPSPSRRATTASSSSLRYRGGGEGLLIKLFSYDCPFCYKYDVAVDPELWERIRETGLRFAPWHIEARGKYGRAASEFLAWCELLDGASGRSVTDADSLYKKAKDAWYKAYNRQARRWFAGEEAFLKTGEDATGLSHADFETARKTPEVAALADLWRTGYDTARIQGIPAYVVHGRFLIMTKSIKSPQGLADLVIELASRKERP